MVRVCDIALHSLALTDSDANSLHSLSHVVHSSLLSLQSLLLLVHFFALVKVAIELLDVRNRVLEMDPLDAR